MAGCHARLVSGFREQKKIERQQKALQAKHCSQLGTTGMFPCNVPLPPPMVHLKWLDIDIVGATPVIGICMVSLNDMDINGHSGYAWLC